MLGRLSESSMVDTLVVELSVHDIFLKHHFAALILIVLYEQVTSLAYCFLVSCFTSLKTQVPCTSLSIIVHICTFELQVQRQLILAWIMLQERNRRAI